jgi:UDP-N-acetylmuramoylalanine--D-glutamate ligase
LKDNLILGFGNTGVSIAKYLLKKNRPFMVVDSRHDLPGIEWIKSVEPDCEIINNFDIELLKKVSTVYVSPGVPVSNPIIMKAIELERVIKTDIDIFLEESSSKKILITGTNGKTTVASMAEKLIAEFFPYENTVAMGNIGKPVLDYIDQDVDISLIEISSFQLEASRSLNSEIAILLNVTPDHLDRHNSFDEYRNIKEKVFSNTQIKIREGASTQNSNDILFYINLFIEYEDYFLGLENNFPAHDIDNIRAAMSILFAILMIEEKIDIDNRKDWKQFVLKSLNILKSFKRLPHRFEILTTESNIIYINDSKATNIHSMLNALDSVSKRYGLRKAILICGGDTKNQDLKLLQDIPSHLIKRAIIFGQDKDLIFHNMKDKKNTIIVDSMKEAVNFASSQASSGDVILLSPAAASTDMYLDYMERGREFISLVKLISKK